MTDKDYSRLKQLNNVDTHLSNTDRIPENLEEEYIHDLKLIKDRTRNLIAVIGHDIKTPICSIIDYLSLLKEGGYDQDKNKTKECVDVALFSARKSLILLNSLLEWAFAENTIKLFNRECNSLNELMKEVIESVQTFASYKLISIETINIPSEPIYIDKNMIKTVLRNLLTNAIKYSHKNGEIVVGAIKVNGFIEMSIKDYGVGINKDKLDSVFNPTIHNTPGTFSESGTGYGLMICKTFVDMHLGEIWVISKPGEGSEFKFTLPLSLHII